MLVVVVSARLVQTHRTRVWGFVAILSWRNLEVFSVSVASQSGLPSVEVLTRTRPQVALQSSPQTQLSSFINPLVFVLARRVQLQTLEGLHFRPGCCLRSS